MNRTINLPEIRDLISRHSIGADWFNELTATATNYPPYNIEQLAEHDYRLTMAVAGFSREEIEITLDNGKLKITGNHAETATIDEDVTLRSSYVMIHKGIAERDFTREFKLGEHVEIAGAALKDGMLTVNLHRVVPEALKPRTISIS